MTNKINNCRKTSRADTKTTSLNYYVTQPTAPMWCNVMWHCNRFYVTPHYAYHQVLLWPLTLTNFLYIQSPTYIIFTFCNVRRKSNFAQFVTEYTFMLKGVQLKSALLHTGTWQTSASQPHRLCYRPTVFHHHLRCTALSFPQGKTRRTSKKCTFSNLFSFFRTACLILRNLKLCRKGGST
jgi:hypothetical protein